MNKIDTIKTILQTLKDAPESVQQLFKDASMVHSDNSWHDLVSNDLEGFVDTYNDDPYTWYRSDELESYGYIHEDELWDKVDDDGEGLDRLLSKNNEMRLAKETVSKLYNDKRKLTKDEKDLIEAFLDEQTSSV